MPRIRTDDGPSRLRAVWLGPKGTRWPVDWTYVQHATFWAMVFTLPVVIFAALVLIDVWFALWLGLLGSPVIAYYITKRIPDWVDYDRPLRYWVQTIRGEFRTSTRMAQLAERRESVAVIPPAELGTRTRVTLWPASQGHRAGDRPTRPRRSLT